MSFVYDLITRKQIFSGTPKECVQFMENYKGAGSILLKHPHEFENAPFGFIPLDIYKRLKLSYSSMLNKN